MVYLALLTAFLTALIAIPVWCARVIDEFALPKPWTAELKRAAMAAFEAPNLTPITFSTLQMAAAAAFAIALTSYLFRNPHRRRRQHVRGSAMAPVAVLRRMTNAGTLRNRVLRVQAKRKFSTKRSIVDWAAVLKRPPPQISLCGVKVPQELEPLHFLIAGTTGAGKSQAIKEMVASAVARGDRLIMVDPNGDYYAAFGKDDDVILNPFDQRSPGWSIFNELRSPFDCERYARSVVPDGKGDLAEWNGYAQFLVRETLRKLYGQGCRETDILFRFISQLTSEDLGKYLADTPAAGLFGSNPDNNTIGSTRFIATRYLGAHKHPQPGSFSIREWLETATGNLYITWREDMADALRPLISTWFDVLITSTLSMPVHGTPRPMWFVCDELGSLEQLSSLEAGLTKGRKHGARFLCGIQSTAQLDGIYGKEKATTLRSCYRNALFLNIPNSDPQTAEELSRGIGEIQELRKEVSRTIGFKSNSRSVSRRQVTEKLILPSQLHDLPNLEGYLCLAGEYPISKVRVPPIYYAPQAEAFIARPEQSWLSEPQFYAPAVPPAIAPEQQPPQSPALPVDGSVDLAGVEMGQGHVPSNDLLAHETPLESLEAPEEETGKAAIGGGKKSGAKMGSSVRAAEKKASRPRQSMGMR